MLNYLSVIPCEAASLDEQTHGPPSFVFYCFPIPMLQTISILEHLVLFKQHILMTDNKSI